MLLPGLAEDGELYVPDWLFDLSAMTLRGYAPPMKMYCRRVIQSSGPCFSSFAFSSSSLGVVGITGGIGRLSEARWV